MPPGNGPQPRTGSPDGGSTLVTSAPRSTSSLVQYGPAMSSAISTTRSPCERAVMPVSRWPSAPCTGAARESAAFAAQPALLEAAERRIAWDATVYGDLPGADAARDGDRAVDVGTPHRAGQPVLRVVGDRDRLVVVPVAKNRQHRSEHFFLGDGGVRPTSVRIVGSK